MTVSRLNRDHRERHVNLLSSLRLSLTIVFAGALVLAGQAELAAGEPPDVAKDTGQVLASPAE